MYDRIIEVAQKIFDSGLAIHAVGIGCLVVWGVLEIIALQKKGLK